MPRKSSIKLPLEIRQYYPKHFAEWSTGTKCPVQTLKGKKKHNKFVSYNSHFLNLRPRLKSQRHFLSHKIFVFSCSPSSYRKYFRILQLPHILKYEEVGHLTLEDKE